jgi:hypothetical protein
MASLELQMPVFDNIAGGWSGAQGFPWVAESRLDAGGVGAGLSPQGTRGGPPNRGKARRYISRIRKSHIYFEMTSRAK